MGSYMKYCIYKFTLLVFKLLGQSEGCVERHPLAVQSFLLCQAEISSIL